MLRLWNRLIETALAAPSFDGASHTLTGVSAWNAGGVYSFATVLANIINVLMKSVVPIAAAIFITGALLYTASFGKDNIKTLGKGMMIGSIVGVIIVLLARGIIHLTFYFLWWDSI